MDEFKKLRPWPQILLTTVVIELIVVGLSSILAPTNDCGPWGCTGPGFAIMLLGILISPICIFLQIVSGLILIFRKKMIVFAVLGLLLVFTNFYFIIFLELWIGFFRLNFLNFLQKHIFFWPFLVISLVEIRAYFYFKKDLISKTMGR